MCFSASASFGASVVLGIAGVMSVKKAEKPSQLFFASIPLIFAAQQFIEGWIWIALNHSLHWDFIPINLFLIIAQVLWPVWIPLSLMLIENQEGHKKVLALFLAFGVVLGMYLTWCLIFYKVDAYITYYHIHYELYFPQKYNTPVGTIYFLATVVPPFLSTQKRMMLIGTFNFISFAIASVFYQDHIISVWCFFAALISWQVFLVMKELKAQYKEKPELLYKEPTL
jgi:hypothetical protein